MAPTRQHPTGADGTPTARAMLSGWRCPRKRAHTSGRPSDRAGLCRRNSHGTRSFGFFGKLKERCSPASAHLRLLAFVSSSSVEREKEKRRRRCEAGGAVRQGQTEWSPTSRNRGLRNAPSLPRQPQAYDRPALGTVTPCSGDRWHSAKAELAKESVQLDAIHRWISDRLRD